MVQVKGPSAKSDLRLPYKPSSANSVSTLAVSRPGLLHEVQIWVTHVTTKIIVIKVEAEKSKQPLLPKGFPTSSEQH